MSHHHHHDHGDHHDGHHHHDDHEHTHHHNQSELSFEQKVVMLLEHWIRHNDDHAESYRDWSKKLADNRMDQIGDLITQAAQQTDEITRLFKQALDRLKER